MPLKSPGWCPSGMRSLETGPHFPRDQDFGGRGLLCIYSVARFSCIVRIAAGEAAKAHMCVHRAHKLTPGNVLCRRHCEARIASRSRHAPVHWAGVVLEFCLPVVASRAPVGLPRNKCRLHFAVPFDTAAVA